MDPILCEDEMWYRLTADFLNGVDPLQLSKSLYENGIISETVYEQIFEMMLNDVERKEICKALLDNLTGVYSINLIINSLRKCGYHRLAKKLYFLTDLNKSSIDTIRKTSSQPNKKVHTFFKNVKRLVHNAAFKNPRKALRNMAKYFREKLSLESNTREQQRIADKYVALLGAEIDAIAISFDHQLPDNAIFTELKNLVDHSTNTLITDIIYYGRLANANAIGNNFEDGKRMLLAARQSAVVLDQCLELINVYYIEVYVRLWEFESNPTTELKDSLINMGYIGLKCLKQEDEDIQVLWTRMFILRMVFCLLGIGNRANIIQGYCPNKDDIEHAKYLLANLDEYWHGIETRREMFYSVAKARLNELERNVALAYVFAKKALQLADMGKFKELIFIRQYLTRIEKEVKETTWLEHLPIAAGVKISTSEDTDHTCLKQKDALQEETLESRCRIKSFTKRELSHNDTTLKENKDSLYNETNMDIQTLCNFPSLHSYTTASSSSCLHHGYNISTYENPYVEDETELKIVNSVCSEKCIYGKEDEKRPDFFWDFPVLNSDVRSSVSTSIRSSVERNLETNEKGLETFVQLRKHRLPDVSSENVVAHYHRAMPEIQHQFPELHSESSSFLTPSLNNVSTADIENGVDRLQPTPGNRNTQSINDVSVKGGIKFTDDPRYTSDTGDHGLSSVGSTEYLCSFEKKHSQSDILKYSNENQKQTN